MKRFRFKLDPLIKVREHREKTAQLAFAEAKRETAAQEEEMARMRAELEQRTAAFDAAVARGLSAGQFRLYAEFLEGMELDLQEGELRHQELLKAEEEKRQELGRKSVEKRILESLKERKKDLYYKEMRQEEQKGADDMTVLRKARDINR